MKNNKLTIQINKSVAEIFEFTITPPNSTKWIPNIVKEEINEWPIRIGTIYKLQDNKGEWTEVVVENLKKDEFVEWASKDKNYHCRYLFKTIKNGISELAYTEWVNKGQINEPFTMNILGKLKLVLET